MEVTISLCGHLLYSLSTPSKLSSMNKATSNPGAGRGPIDHEVRDQIVTAATEHFRLYGYEKTTVSDLAKAIGFSKAYIYKFFESKQAIGEQICANCLSEIESDIRTAVESADLAPEKLRRMFKAVVESSMRLFFEDRRLYDIAASAATEQWEAAKVYEHRIKAIVQEVLRLGRETGDFERKTPLDETVNAIHLVIRPYFNPLILQHSLDTVHDAPAQLSSLILRSLSR